MVEWAVLSTADMNRKGRAAVGTAHKNRMKAVDRIRTEVGRAQTDCTAAAYHQCSENHMISTVNRCSTSPSPNGHDFPS